MATGSLHQTYMPHDQLPLIIAHRGTSWRAPENTLAAFQLAWDETADGIETDVRLTSDGRIVCIHDADTKRVAGEQVPSLTIASASWNVLRALDVGAWRGDEWRGQRIPLLEEMFASVPDDKWAFIEIKSGPETVEPLIPILRKSRREPERTILMSFHRDVMIALHDRLPQFRRHLLIEYGQRDDGRWQPAVEDIIDRVRHVQAGGLGTENRPQVVRADFVDKLRSAGIEEFHVWTVDDPAEARQYQALGAFAITTNGPAKTRLALAG
jgi:glycerophosphoryl diester phosphodiesterase